MLRKAVGFLFDFVEATTRPWRQLIWFAWHFCFSIWATVLAWSIQLCSAPLRILLAPYNERQLSARLRELQTDYELIKEKNQDLERRLNWAWNNQKQLKKSLEQALQAENRYFERLNILKSRVRDLEEQRLKLEQPFKHRKLLKQVVAVDGKDICCGFPTRRGPWKQLSNFSLGQSKSDMGVGFKHEDNQTAFPPSFQISFQTKAYPVVDARVRWVALVSSVFSATLCAIVAIIVWEAQDPFMPLVTALFIVSGIPAVLQLSAISW